MTSDYRTKINYGLPGMLSSSDDAPNGLPGVAGLLDQVGLPLTADDGRSDGSVEVGEGLVPLPGGLLQGSHRMVDGFAHQDRMAHQVGLVQLTATRMWPNVSGMTITCPTATHALDGTEHTIIGCGSTNVTGPDDEGLYDCGSCGIWLDPSRESAPSAPARSVVEG